MKLIKDFVQDDSFIIRITYNPIIDISGSLFELTLKSNPDSIISYTLASYTAPVGGDSTNGVVNIPVTREATSAVPQGSYYVTLKKTLGDNTITLARSGKSNIDKVTVYKTLIEKVT